MSDLKRNLEYKKALLERYLEMSLKQFKYFQNQDLARFDKLWDEKYKLQKKISAADVKIKKELNGNKEHAISEVVNQILNQLEKIRKVEGDIKEVVQERKKAISREISKLHSGRKALKVYGSNPGTTQRIDKRT